MTADRARCVCVCVNRLLFDFLSHPFSARDRFGSRGVRDVLIYEPRNVSGFDLIHTFCSLLRDDGFFIIKDNNNNADVGYLT